MKLNKKIQIILLFILFFFLYALPVNAALVDDLKSKISDKTTKIEKIKNDIAKYQKEIDTLGGKSDTLKNSIRKLNLTRKKLEAGISFTQTKINSATLNIKKISFDIYEKNAKINKSNNTIGTIIRKIDNAESNTLFEVMLSNNTFSSFLDNIENLKNLQSVVSKNLKDMKELKAGLEVIKTKGEGQKKSLQNFQSDLSDQKKIAENNRVKKYRLLRDTKNKESNYRNLIAKKKKEQATFERDLLAIESQLHAVINPNSIPKPGTKIFALPLGDVAFKSCYNKSTKAKNCVTQFFGNTPFAKSGAYKGKTHNGIDFRASIGTKVRAVLGGTVLRTNSKIAPMCQYGRWVVIKHNNGLTTLYGHMSLVKVVAGQKVNTGDVVGYTGDSGYAFGPHLHFTTYASQAVTFKDYKCKSGPTVEVPVAALNAYLNPLDYF